MAAEAGWFDVAVVGAGPAGCTAARLLAARGLDVLLLERERLPRYKVCGGGVTAKALPLLPAGVAAAARDRVCRAEVGFGSLRFTVSCQGQAVAMFMRDELDHALAVAAREAGARLREGVAVRAVHPVPGGVELDTGAGPVRARYAALASGAAGLPGGTRRLAAGFEAELDAGADAGSWAGQLVGDFDAVPGGYGWVFPKGDILSVGVATWRRSAARGVRPALQAYLGRLGLARHRVLRLRGHPIPVGATLGPEALAAGRVLRLGDAAGLNDPFFGEGIYYALRSAQLGASAIAAAARSVRGGDLRPYRSALEADLLPQLRVLAALARCFYPLAGGWVRLISAVPRAVVNALFAEATGAGLPGHEAAVGATGVGA